LCLRIVSRRPRRPQTPGSNTSAHKEAALAAKLPDETTAYALRHRVITDLISREGLDLLTVAQLSGTCVAMIEKHYGHLQTDRAIAALAGLVL
jgi:integrase